MKNAGKIQNLSLIYLQTQFNISELGTAQPQLVLPLFGNIIFKCPSVTEKITYFTAHMGHSGMST